jgi:cyclic pyranopterin phosphate synthase
VGIVDRYDRPLRSLRISVTDRCNLRCGYCMPEGSYRWLPRPDLLTFEEIGALAEVFAGLGVTKIRLTGGEPLLRVGLVSLVAIIARTAGITDLALTTNGALLSSQAAALCAAGLGRIAVSLDTLDAAKFRELTRTGDLHETVAGIDAACSAGLPLKINTVVIRGFNDGELGDLVERGREWGAEVRFIEFMDVGGATQWSMSDVLAREEILAKVEACLGKARPLPGRGAAPAERFELPDGTRFGVIASTTAPFCGTCDRARVTADGHWFHCLYASQGIDLRAALRDGRSADELAAMIRSGWRQRTDRGAEERLRVAARGPLFPADALRDNPHLEMHTKGG